MPIEEAIKIIKDGANTHFDARVTDMFLSLPCDKIIDVTLSDGDVILDVEIVEKSSNNTTCLNLKP